MKITISNAEKKKAGEDLKKFAGKEIKKMSNAELAELLAIICQKLGMVDVDGKIKIYER